MICYLKSLQNQFNDDLGYCVESNQTSHNSAPSTVEVGLNMRSCKIIFFDVILFGLFSSKIASKS